MKRILLVGTVVVFASIVVSALVEIGDPRPARRRQHRGHLLKHCVRQASPSVAVRFAQLRLELRQSPAIGRDPPPEVLVPALKQPPFVAIARRPTESIAHVREREAELAPREDPLETRHL